VNQSFLENLNSFCALMSVSAKFYKSNPLNKDVSLNIRPADMLNALSSLNEYDVQYLIVDGLACVLYGHIRTSLDLSLWIESSPINKANLGSFLKHSKEDGLKLNLLDNLHQFKQADFDQCYTRATTGSLDNVPFSLIALADLIRDKQASLQLQDLADAEALGRMKPFYL
jgi:hypothetical protein